MVTEQQQAEADREQMRATVRAELEGELRLAAEAAQEAQKEAWLRRHTFIQQIDHSVEGRSYEVVERREIIGSFTSKKAADSAHKKAIARQRKQMR